MQQLSQAKSALSPLSLSNISLNVLDNAQFVSDATGSERSVRILNERHGEHDQSVLKTPRRGSQTPHSPPRRHTLTKVTIFPTSR
jgi:hypothetical protein